MTPPIKMMTTEQVREYMDTRKPDEYQLLDVRQEWEYEEFHLPGARLVPLADLHDRLGEIDREKPAIVYCASGGRSMAASTLLEGQGFSDVSNMVGGAMAWQGHTAYGPMELGMTELSGNEAPVEILLKAYAMESELQRFYVQRADDAETVERIGLFTELAGFEDRHKDTLYNLYTKVVDDMIPRHMFESVAFKDSTFTAEGGVDIEEFLEEYAEAFDNDQGILQMALMIEAQALDFYLRCAMKAKTAETEKVLQILAREEKAHLKLLGRFMDRRED